MHDGGESRWCIRGYAEQKDIKVVQNGFACLGCISCISCISGLHNGGRVWLGHHIDVFLTANADRRELHIG